MTSSRELRLTTNAFYPQPNPSPPPLPPLAPNPWTMPSTPSTAGESSSFSNTAGARAHARAISGVAAGRRCTSHMSRRRVSHTCPNLLEERLELISIGISVGERAMISLPLIFCGEAGKILGAVGKNVCL